MVRKLGLAAACAAILSSGLAQAENIIGVTGTFPYRLISFDSATPGNLTGNVIISGIPASAAGASFAPISLDFRPATNQAYMVVRGPDTAQCRLYTLTAAGVAAAVGTGTYLCGTPGEIDFNPAADRVRVIRSGAGSAVITPDNYRLNPNDGTRLGTAGTPPSDTLATYVSGDTGAGLVPEISGSAYDQSVSGTTTTTLFAIDIGRNRLVQIGGVNGTPSPNGGGVTTINPTGLGLGIAIIGDPNFDISGSTGAAYLTAFINAAAPGSPAVFEQNFYAVDLLTGSAARLGTTPIGSGSVNGLVGMTVAPNSFNVARDFIDLGSGAMPWQLLLALAGFGGLRRSLRRRAA